jgi:hypothetical protein
MRAYGVVAQLYAMVVSTEVTWRAANTSKQNGSHRTPQSSIDSCSMRCNQYLPVHDDQLVTAECRELCGVTTGIHASIGFQQPKSMDTTGARTVATSGRYLQSIAVL